MARVTWTDAEREALAERVSNARLLHPEKSLLALIQGQVPMMPSDRQRKLGSLKDDPELLDKIRLRLIFLREAAAKGLQPPEKVYVEPEPSDFIAKLSAPQLTLYLAQRLFAELDVLREGIHRIEEKMIVGPPGAAAPRTPAKRDKLRLTVVGPLPAQFHEIQAAIGNAADLRYVDKEDKPHFPFADHVFLMRKFISHAWQEKAYEQFDRDRVHLVEGGVSSMILEIRRVIGS